MSVWAAADNNAIATATAARGVQGPAFFREELEFGCEGASVK